VQKGVVVKLAGYSREELQSLPPDAVINSFGCGNPLALSDISEGDVVLDLGSGAGIDILIAAKLVGKSGRAIGIDMTDAMIERARANIAAAGLDNAEIRKGMIEALPVDSESVDWVISNCVINLSPEKKKVFTEIARVLKPGGRLLISDIVADEMPEWIRTNRELHSACIAGAVSEASYLDNLRAVGLIEIEVRERIAYDEAELGDFVESEVKEARPGSASEAAPPAPAREKVVNALLGKLWSARIYARKPTGV
jgi:SAM-dependent methyltransferase